ncbi:MAG: hypothetical protein Q8O62_13795 [Aequorivita sp.]|nr:hypothetical protein [Aequorivita sp.]
MYFKIDVITTEIYSKEFPIILKDIEEVMESCYLGLGTSYQPIPADNFMSIGDNKFPDIPSNAKINIKLYSENEDAQIYKLTNPQLVCCTLKNIGKAFNDKDFIANDYWNIIFDCNPENILSAPDGTLYIAPVEENVCVIATKNDFPETLAAYSILFSLNIENTDGYGRKYYFILDPVVRIRSRPGI